MLLLDLGTLQFGSHLKMEERLKKYYERKKKGMEMFLLPSVIQEMREYEMTVKSDTMATPSLSKKEMLEEDDKEMSIFYNKFSLHVLALQALMLRTNIDYEAVKNWSLFFFSKVCVYFFSLFFV